MKQYKKYVIPYKSAFILGPIFMIVEVLGEIILPKLMSMIINYGCGQDVTVAAICEEMCLPKCRNFPLPILKNFQPVL